MRVLIDTQVLLMAYLVEALPKRAETLLANSETDRLLSAVSIVEIALKSSTYGIRREYIEEATTDLGLTIIPFAPSYAMRLFALPQHHRDPFDRMLIATALTEDIPVMTGDRKFKQYRGLRVIW